MLNLCIVYSDDLCPLCKNQLCFDRVWGFYILLNDWVVLYTQLWWIYMISFLSRWRKKFWLSLAWKLALVCYLDCPKLLNQSLDLVSYLTFVLLKWQKRAVGDGGVLLHFFQKGACRLQVKAANLGKLHRYHLWNLTLLQMKNVSSYNILSDFLWLDSGNFAIFRFL